MKIESKPCSQASCSTFRFATTPSFGWLDSVVGGGVPVGVACSDLVYGQWIRPSTAPRQLCGTTHLLRNHLQHLASSSRRINVDTPQRISLEVVIYSFISACLHEPSTSRRKQNSNEAIAACFPQH
jgi:hypothetical protein